MEGHWPDEATRLHMQDACRRLHHTFDAIALTNCLLPLSIWGGPADRNLLKLPAYRGSYRHHWQRVLKDAVRIQLPLVERWHLESQYALFRHLRQLWSDNVPRVMVDLGCHAGHTHRHNVSDITLWLDFFSHAGGAVLGVDVMEDWVHDLQHRLDDVQPYASLPVEKRTRTLAIARSDSLDFRVHNSTLLSCTTGW